MSFHLCQLLSFIDGAICIRGLLVFGLQSMTQRTILDTISHGQLINYQATLQCRNTLANAGAAAHAYQFTYIDTLSLLLQRFHLPPILVVLDGTHLNGFLATGIDANRLCMGVFSTSQTCNTTNLRGFTNERPRQGATISGRCTEAKRYSSLLPTAPKTEFPC